MIVNLADLLPDTRKVLIGKGEVEVFGLDLAQIAVLLTKYGSQLEVLFSTDKSLTSEESPDFEKLAGSIPYALEEVVSMGIRAEGQDALVSRIPFSAKVEILQAVWELSVHDPKKLIEALTAMASRLREFTAQKD